MDTGPLRLRPPCVRPPSLVEEHERAYNAWRDAKVAFQAYVGALLMDDERFAAENETAPLSAVYRNFVVAMGERFPVDLSE